MLVFYFKHRDTEIQNDILSMPQIQSSFNLNTKKQRLFPGQEGNKRIKSRHKALRMKNFVAFVKAALAALCIFRYRKRHSVFVPLCLKSKTLWLKIISES